MDNNLLIDHWLTITNASGERQKVNLPELFSALERNDVLDFPALMPHQRGPFHVFLTQLACHALQTSGMDENLPPADPNKPWTLLGEHTPEGWLSMIRGIVPDYAQIYPTDEPWCFCVDDPAMPAFLQCPDPENKCKDLDKTYDKPDDLDLKISSKNHFVKSATFAHAEVEYWVLALISLQTNAGYLGPGNFGCARQNGGWSQRPVFTLQKTSSPGARLGRDARIILTCKGTENDKLYGVCESDGKRLLWLDPWDGKTSYEPSELHPLFIEISRRVRVMRDGDDFKLMRGTSKCTRINSKQLGGNLGDPWEPTVSNNKGVTSVFASGLDYANIAKILCDADGMSKNMLLYYHDGIDSKDGLELWCSAIVKGQGKTEGYYERIIPVNARKLRLARNLWTYASRMLDLADEARKVYRIVAAVYLSCRKAEADINWQESSIKTCLPKLVDVFDREIDNAFFEVCWAIAQEIEDGEELNESRLDIWRVRLAAIVRTCYRRDVLTLPGNASTHLKAKALSEIRMGQLIAKHLLPAKEEEDNNAAS